MGVAVAVGAALAALVVVLVALFGLWLDHRGAKRDSDLKAQLDGYHRLVQGAVAQYGRHETELADLHEVVVDHAEAIDELVGHRRAARPQPRK